MPNARLPALPANTHRCGPSALAAVPLYSSLSHSACCFSSLYLYSHSSQPVLSSPPLIPSLSLSLNLYISVSLDAFLSLISISCPSHHFSISLSFIPHFSLSPSHSTPPSCHPSLSSVSHTHHTCLSYQSLTLSLFLSHTSTISQLLFALLALVHTQTHLPPVLT